MKLTFKDLKQQKFVIEAEGSETILEVKEKIAKEKGWEASLQKLIYSGKILQDAQTVESYKIEEKGFVVCMVQKPKTPSAASSSKAPSTPAPAVAQTPAPPAAPTQSSSTAPAVPATPTPVGATDSASIATPSTPAPSAAGAAIASERAAQIEEMTAMGFARPQIEAALRAAYYNSERAIEYLLSGIPENLQNERQLPAAAAGAGSPSPAPASAVPIPGLEGGDEGVDLFQQAAQAAQAGRGGAAGGATGGLGNLNFLRDNPQFQQLRQVVQQNPQMLEPILQQLGAGNPQLATAIGRNQEEFLQLLSEDAENDAPLPPGAASQQISVTEDEREAIERLCRLGFSRELAIQAYFACDKNEELAANFLFDQPEDEE